MNLLAEVPLLANLDAGMRARVATACTHVRLHAGEVLCRQGDDGDDLFVVRAGRLTVTRDAGDSETLLATLGRGAIIGEMALLTGSARTATVTAVRDSELLRVARAGFMQLLEDPAFALALTRALAERLSAAAAPAEGHGRRVTVVTVAAAEPGLPVHAVAAAFRSGPPSRWRVAVIDTPAADAPPDAVTWADRVERAERDADLVVLLAEAPYGSGGRSLDPWTAFALRQADRALLLARPGAAPPAGADPSWDVGFVCAAPSAEAVRPWAQRCRTHHWLRPHRLAADAEAMARRVTGTALGLVCSGGGARGLAHIGVLAAFADAGVPIDRLGGTSVGAFVSALAADGRSPDEIAALCRVELVERRPFTDYTIPRHALIRARRGVAMLRRVFEDRRAEALPLPWFAITCDLLAGEMVVQRHGPVRHIVGASMALPGLAPPRWFLGRLLVDGGVVNNLPVDVMLEDGAGDVVAVDVMRQWHNGPPPGESPGRRRGLPSIVDTLSAASGLSGRQGAAVNRRMARLVITPDLAGVGLLEWGRQDMIVAAGRAAAERALADLGDVGELFAAPPPSRVSSLRRMVTPRPVDGNARGVCGGGNGDGL